MNNRDDKAIDIFHNNYPRKILQIRWQDHVRTKELWERVSLKLLSEEVNYRRWNMIGHILRQDRNIDSNIAIRWSLEGKRRQGKEDREGQRQHGDEQLKGNVKRQGRDHGRKRG